jgi:hypothetical protein
MNIFLTADDIRPIVLPHLLPSGETSSGCDTFCLQNVRALRQIYHLQAAQSEIEVLCKGVDIDLDPVEVTTFLRNRPLTDSLGGHPLPDYVPDIDALPIGGYDPTAHLQGDSQVLALGHSSPSNSQRVIGARMESILLSLAHHVSVGQHLAPLLQHRGSTRSLLCWPLFCLSRCRLRRPAILDPPS